MYDQCIVLISDNDQITPKIELSGVIGQNSVVNKLRFFLASHSVVTPFPTLLMTGSHGLGKTFIAEKLAHNLNRRFIEVNSSTIENTKDFYENLIFGRVIGQTPATILFDEAHSLNNEITTILLTALSPKNGGKTILSYKSQNIEYDMSKINVVFATTDAHLIFKPLINRSTRIYFDAYSPEEMIDMLQLYLPKIKIACNKTDLAMACRGRGRDAYQLAQNINRYCTMYKTNVLDDVGWKFIKNLFEIYPMGLNKQELDLLGFIELSGPISCANLAMHFMINEENIEQEIEVRLRELGFIQNTTKGRIITDDGKKYLITTGERK
jgi:holliday junction DNA helicase RuvB